MKKYHIQVEHELKGLLSNCVKAFTSKEELVNDLFYEYRYYIEKANFVNMEINNERVYVMLRG